MGYKYVSHDLVAAIGYRHGHLYVTPVRDTTGGVKLRRLCGALFDATKTPILLKKIQRHAFEQMVFPVDLPHDDLPLEDDSCPESVLHLRKLFVSPAGDVNPVAKNLIRRARAFENAGIQLHPLDDITQVPFEELERFLARDPVKYANYLPIVTYLYAQRPDRYKYQVMVFTDGSRIRGLYMTEVLSLTELGMYGGITSKDASGLTEWMDLHFFRKVFSEGIRTVHLGGAESNGVAQYVGKLLPYRPSYFAQTIRFDSALPKDDVTVRVRAVREGDLDELAQLYRNFYNALDDLGELWTKESAHRFVAHFYRRQPDLFYLAELGDRIVGATVAAVQPWWDGNHLVEGEIFIDSLYEDTDLSRQLLRELLVRARDKYHTVTWDTIMPTSDKHPLGSYKRIGFDELPLRAAITGDVHTVLEKLGA